jgi:CheY-like chemotaxis protein
MKILIVEDDPSLRKVLTELVQTEILDAEILEADNLDDAVKIICSPESRIPSPESRVPSPESRAPSPDPRAAVAAILTDGTFPTWPQKVLPTSVWNASRPNWIGLAGWAEKKHIPLVVLTGAGEVFDHARRVGVPVFMKPLQVHRAIASLRALVVPKGLRENPVVAEVDLENEEAKRRKWEVGNRK